MCNTGLYKCEGEDLPKSVFKYIVEMEMITIAIKKTNPALRVRLIIVGPIATISKEKMSPKDAMPIIN